MVRLLANYVADAIERTLLINVTPQNALESLAKLLSRPPYALSAERPFEGDPLRSGVLVYYLSNPRRKKFGVLAGSAFERAINVADGQYLLVTVREAGENVTRLSVRMPLYRRQENVALFGIFAGAAGLVGTTFASYIIPWTNTPSALSALIPAVAGAVGIMTGAAIYRRLYRWAMRWGEAALERMLQAISHDERSTESPHVPPAKD